MHTAISSHTPPGQGDLGRETVVGSTPSTPMMAHITKWEPSSLPFPHAYTPLRCCRRPPSASSGGAIPSAVVHVRAELFARARPAAIGRQVRRARAPPARTSCRTHPRLGALLGRPACVPGPCTQSTVFNIPACPCAQEASSTYPLFTPNASLCGSWPQVRFAARPVPLGPPAAHPPPMCLRSAGPRATPSTASHEPGLLAYVLFPKVLPVPALLVHLFDFRLELSCAVLCACRVVLVCRCRAYAQDLEWLVLSM